MAKKNGKITPDIIRKIVQALEVGNYDHVAARYAGIHPQTFYAWMAKGEQAKRGIYHEFYEQVQDAKAKAEVAAVASVRKAWDADWRAAMKYLERKHPERWSGTQNIDLNVGFGGPVPERPQATRRRSLSDLGLSAAQVELLGRQLAQLESQQPPLLEVEADEAD